MRQTEIQLKTYLVLRCLYAYRLTNQKPELKSLLAKWRIRSENGSDRSQAGRFVLISVRQRQWAALTGLMKWKLL